MRYLIALLLSSGLAYGGLVPPGGSGTDGAGIPDAPADGNGYVRKDQMWTNVESVVTTEISDSITFSQLDPTNEIQWVHIASAFTIAGMAWDTKAGTSAFDLVYRSTVTTPQSSYVIIATGLTASSTVSTNAFAYSAAAGSYLGIFPTNNQMATNLSVSIWGTR